MIAKESDTRLIGYGSMLMEGLVGVVALIAATSLFPVIISRLTPLKKPIPRKRLRAHGG